MSQRNASAGWAWIKQGFGMLRKQPGELSTMLMGYMCALLVFSLIPLIGPLLPALLMPMLSVAFMRAGAHIELGRRAMPSLLLSGFRQPVLKPLLALGFVNLVVMGLAIAIFLGVNDGTYVKVVTGELARDAEEVRNSNFGTSLLSALLFYVPFGMALLFAPALVYWQKMAVGKAIFYSFFAVIRSLKSFIVFILCWFAILIVPAQIVAMLFGRTSFGVILMVPLSLILTVVLQCSFYASYRDIFGLPDNENEPEKPVIPPAE